MSSLGAPRPCYLVEWYRPEVVARPLEEIDIRLRESAAAMSRAGSAVKLLLVIAVANDDVVFGIFIAHSELVVEQTCQRAGIPAQRVTAAVRTRVTADDVGKPRIPQ